MATIDNNIAQLTVKEFLSKDKYLKFPTQINR